MKPLLEEKIQKQLNELDFGLFLDKEAFQGLVVYSVKHAHKIGEEPNTVLRWTDPYGRPRPLSEDIILAVRAQEGDIREAIQLARLNNLLKKEEARKRRHEETDERAKEFEKSSKILHRSGPWLPKHDVSGYSLTKQRQKRESQRGKSDDS